MSPAEVRAATMNLVRRALGMEIMHRRRRRLQAVAAQLLLGIAGLAVVTFVCFQVEFGVGRTAFAYLILVALLSLLGSFATSVVLSLVAVACLNYFFVPPLFDFRVDDPDDIVRMATFLTTSLVVTALITKRKRTEEDLADSKARLESAQRLAHVGWWERDFTIGHVTLSDEVCRTFGVQPVDLPEWHGRWLELIHPDDRPRVAEAAEAAVRGGPRYDVEYRVVRPDGTARIIHSQGDVTWDEAGKPLRQFGVLQDITDLRRAEEELRESEERFRTLVQFSFDVYWESDAQHRFSRQEFADGLPDAPAPGSEIGKTRWEVPYLEPDAETWRKHRETLDAHLPFRDFELARPVPDGGMRYVSVSGLPVFDGAGRFIGYRGVGRHITERKKAESELRDSQMKLEAAQRIAHVGWWERDFITNRVSLSDEVCRTFGVRPVDLPEWHGRWLDLIHPDDRARAAEAAADALRGGRRYDLEYRVVRPDGSIRTVHSQGDVTWDETGRPVRQFGVLQDITELRQTENELRGSEARFRSFVDHATDAFFLHDDQGIILDVNRQACEGLGYSREELIGMHPRNFDVGLDAPALDRVVEQVLSGQTTSF